MINQFIVVTNFVNCETVVVNVSNIVLMSAIGRYTEITCDFGGKKLIVMKVVECIPNILGQLKNQ